MQIAAQRQIQHTTYHPLLITKSQLSNTLLCAGTDSSTHVTSIHPTSLAETARITPIPYGGDPIGIAPHPTLDIILMHTRNPPYCARIQADPLSLLSLVAHTNYGLYASHLIPATSIGTLIGGLWPTGNSLSANRLIDAAELTPITDPSFPHSLRPLTTDTNQTALYAASVIPPATIIRIPLPALSPLTQHTLSISTFLPLTLLYDTSRDTLLCVGANPTTPAVELDPDSLDEIAWYSAPTLSGDTRAAAINPASRTLAILTTNTNTDIVTFDTTSRSKRDSLTLYTGIPTPAAAMFIHPTGDTIYATTTTPSTTTATIYRISTGGTDHLPLTGIG